MYIWAINLQALVVIASYYFSFVSFQTVLAIRLYIGSAWKGAGDHDINSGAALPFLARVHFIYFKTRSTAALKIPYIWLLGTLLIFLLGL